MGNASGNNIWNKFRKKDEIIPLGIILLLEPILIYRLRTS